MKHLLNTLYILSEDVYLSLDGENIVANRDKQVVARYPLHTLQNIITFSYSGASRQTEYCLCVLYAPGKIPGKDMRRKQWQCAASPNPIPGGRQS